MLQEMSRQWDLDVHGEDSTLRLEALAKFETNVREVRDDKRLGYKENFLVGMGKSMSPSSRERESKS